MFEWDDLRYFAVSVRAGSFTAAARQLHVDTTTVARRVARLESVFKSTLLIRSKNGLELTAAGQRLFVAAEDVESSVETAERAGRGDSVTGCVRVSVPEIFGTEILAPQIPRLRERQNDLIIELVAGNTELSPSKREVDIAVTTFVPENVRLCIEQLADYELGIFAAQDYIDKVGMPETVEDLAGVDWIGYVEDLITDPVRRYIDLVAPGTKPKLASSSMRAQRQFIAGGGGVGIIPVFIAEGLVRLLPKRVRIIRQFWMSTHKDIADTARVKRVRAWIKSTSWEQQGRLVSSDNPPSDL